MVSSNDDVCRVRKCVRIMLFVWLFGDGEKMCMPVVALLCVYGTMISGNEIGDEGIKALVPALQSLTQLHTLNLGSK